MKKATRMFIVKDQLFNRYSPYFYFVNLESAVELFAGKAQKKIKTDAYFLYARI